MCTRSTKAVETNSKREHEEDDATTANEHEEDEEVVDEDELPTLHEIRSMLVDTNHRC